MPYYSKPNYSNSLHEWLARGRKWDIEYGGYLSNHITHNWIVLDAAGGDHQKMQWWEKLYTNQLPTSPQRVEGDLDPPREYPVGYTEITDANWRTNIQSTRIAFPLYRDFFDKKIQELGLSACLNKYFPTLSEGLVGSAFHAVIHLGWAVDVESDNMAAEGLAYLATSFQALATGSEHGKHKLWSTNAIRPINALKKTMTDARIPQLAKLSDELSKTPDYAKLNRGGFQQKIITFNNPNEPMASFLNEVSTLQMPPLEDDLKHVIEELTAVAAIALYSSNNEFFILHGLTSLHGVLSILPHLDERAKRNTLAYWWRAITATTIVQGCPGTKDAIPLLDTWIENLASSSTNYCPTEQELKWWIETLKSTSNCLDEHIPKAVYTLMRWTQWKSFSRASFQAYCRTARNLVRSNQQGQMHENIWFSHGVSSM